MNLSKGIFVTVSVAFVATMGFAAYSSTRVKVESKDGRYSEKRIDLRDARVRLYDRLSDARCQEGRTWGYDRNKIWVDDGCRAVFEVQYNDRRDDRRDDRWDDRRDRDDRRDDRWDNGRRDGWKRIKVESHDRKKVSHFIITHNQVRLAKQLSDAPCTYGRSWGYTNAQVWVDNGCRAEFLVKD